MYATRRVTYYSLYSDDEESLVVINPGPKSCLMSVGKTILSANINVGILSDKDKLTIPYNIEWKLSIDKSRRVGELEPGIVMSL